MSMKGGGEPAKIGRPRAFDVDLALDRALHVFWRKGYEGTSLSDLTKAMRINRPSLYAAFGNKETLFRKTLDRYSQGPTAFWDDALRAPTARAVVERLLRGTIDLLTDPRTPRGCLIVQSALACGAAADSIRQELASRREAGRGASLAVFGGSEEKGTSPQRPTPLTRCVTILMP